MIEYNAEDYQKLAPYYNYGTGSTMGGFMGNTAGVNVAADSRIFGPRPANSIIKAPHLDSPYMDEQIRRGFQPMQPPVRGPQLFPIRRVDAGGGMAPDNTSFYLGPQVGQADQYPATAAGYLNKRVS